MQAETTIWSVTFFDHKSNGVDIEDFEILIKEAKDKGLTVFRITDKSPCCSSFIISFEQGPA